VKRAIWISLIWGVVLAFLFILPMLLAELDVPLGRLILLATATLPLMFPGYAACALLRTSSDLVMFSASWLFYSLFFAAIVLALRAAPRWLSVSFVAVVVLLISSVMLPVLSPAPEIGSLSFTHNGSLLAVTVNGRIDFLDTLTWKRVRQCKHGRV